MDAYVRKERLKNNELSDLPKKLGGREWEENNRIHPKKREGRGEIKKLIKPKVVP